MAVSIEKRYQKLTDTEHVLLRPGMYIGSVKPHTEEVYLFSENKKKFEPTEITYNPGFLKMFDEIVSNSVDEHKRNPKLNHIKITVDKNTGKISIWDNGGIPVKIHKEYNEWVPEMIFSNLKTGSNFDDSEDRTVVGTNGVGSTLTNIFSKEFRIETCDGKKHFVQVFTDNMANKTEPIIKTAKKGFTEISYIADFQRFGMKGIDDASIQMIQKRLYDIAACNLGIKIYLNNKQISFGSFKEYAELYTDYIFYEQSSNWKIGIGHSTVGFKAVSFVNSVETKDGGTHVNNITHQIIQDLREKIKKKHRVDVKPAELKQHLFLFIDCTIINPAFSSQTKEKLITEPKDYGSTHELSERILKQVFSSEIIQSVLDWIERKKAAEERAKLRRLNNNLNKSKVLKLIDAKKSGDRKNCTLAIFEGDSASSAFRRYRDPQTQGAFPLRGKFINVREIPDSKVVQNKEVQSLMAAIGLKIGHEPKDLRYGKILFYMDSDVDGQSIVALLINFFGKYWPELFEQGRMLKVDTPLMVAKKGKNVLSFYSDSEYKQWEVKQKSLSSWGIEYKKGLAALEDEEYKEIIKNPNAYILTKDNEFVNTLNAWFSKDSNPRKLKILGQEPILKSNKKSLF
jgi:DNA topoisomerase-2